LIDSTDSKIGILIRGKISEWTRDIVKEYQKNFPSTKIVLSTWTTENVENIQCEIIQSQEPKIPQPHQLTVNHQILAVRAGLEKIRDCDIILNSRTDQVVHNRNIFEIFKKSCCPNKIMIPTLGTILPDYYIVDYCQIGKRQALLDYWCNVPLFDGSFSISAEVYIPKFYVVNVKKDNRPWSITRDEYFCIKGFHEHFKLEWEKLVKLDSYQQDYKKEILHNSMPYDIYKKLINK
jgi:hypothetical protein